MRRGSIIGGALTCLLAAAAAAEPVDVELVLAVDASGSVNEREFALQIGGLAAAFRDPAVQEAAISGPEGRVAVAVLLWADARGKRAASAWRVIDSPAAADGVAAMIEGMANRRNSALGRSGTGIGAAVAQALEMIRLNEFEGTRKIVDVSGDGRETPLAFGEALGLPEALRRAARREVTVNGLPILADDPNLGLYYERRVISGPDSFALPAADFDDFARAIRLKLLRELRALYGAAPEAPYRPVKTATIRP